MVKGLARSIRRGRLGVRNIRENVPFENILLEVNGGDQDGFGSVGIINVHEGNFLLVGAILTVTISGPITDDLSDVWEGDFSMGSQPTPDGDLTGLFGNIIESTPLGPAVLEVSPETQGAAPAFGTVIDNTGGIGTIYLNICVDKQDRTAGSTVVCLTTGDLRVSYAVLGG